MKKYPDSISIFDLNESAYQFMNGNIPTLKAQGTRITFAFKLDKTFSRLSEQYHSNIQVNVIDFVNAQRQLKSMMMSLKRLEIER